MPEFIRVGNRFLNARDVHGIIDNLDGTLTVDLKGSPEHLDGEEAAVFMDWLKGATVNPEVPPATVPDASGMTAANAIAAIEQADLVCAVAGASEGVVTAQDPAPGSEVKKRSTVTVTLTIPPPEERSPEESDRQRTRMPPPGEPGLTGGSTHGSPALADEPTRQAEATGAEESTGGRRRGRHDRG